MSAIGIEERNLNRESYRSYYINMTKRNLVVSIGGPRFLKRKKTNFCYFGRKGISRDCCRRKKSQLSCAFKCIPTHTRMSWMEVEDMLFLKDRLE